MISAVVPVAPGDTAWKILVENFELPAGSEIVLAVGDADFDLSDVVAPKGVSVVVCREGSGRAGQMNAGAHVASQDFLWFVHADSQLSKDSIEKVVEVSSSPQNSLYYLDLKFADDGPARMKLNEIAVYWRSILLKIPFGDQGFSISRKLFEEIGGYRTDLPYGEDHVFVWKVRQEGYPVVRIPADIITSARKYEQNGWGSTTAKHVWFTIRQALPEYFALWRRRIERVIS